MHSSRMHTCCLLTVFRGVSGPRGVSACLWGVWLRVPGLGGVCLRGSALGGVCLRGGCLLQGVSALGGVVYFRGCLLWGVVYFRGCLPGGSASGGVSALGGCLPWGGGVCSQGGVSQHALRQTPPPLTESQTPVKTLPWPNFVAAGNYQKYPEMK